ncbi:MAG: DedA family protein [Rubricella sp.]
MIVETLGEFGLAGVFGLTLFERVIPILPSYALYAFVGLTAASGAFPLVLAILAAWAGSLLGMVPFYLLGRAIGPDRALGIVRRIAKWTGLGADRGERWFHKAEEHGVPIVGVGQLVPTVRLITPLFAGLLKLPFGPSARALAAGSFAWIAFFTVGAWFLALLRPDADPNWIAVVMTIALVVVEVVILGTIYLVRRRRRTVNP